MIEINLLPPQLKKKKKTGILGGMRIPPEIIIGAGGGVIMLLILLDVYLLVLNLSKLSQNNNLNHQWEQLQPQKAAVDVVLNQLRELQSSIKTINDVTQKGSLYWAEKLNIISDSLPKGVWLQKLSLNDGVLFIEGSAISKQQKELFNVHLFDSNLRSSTKFLEHFKDFEPGSTQRRKVLNMEVVDFLITIKLK